MFKQGIVKIRNVSTVLLLSLFASAAWAGAVNINTADQQALTQLNGVGPSKAAAIVEYRNTVGRFDTKDDLQKVDGIGPKTLEQDRAMIEVGEQ